MAGVLIVNPRASGVSAAVVERVRAALPADVELVETKGPGDATALARRHESDADSIYVLSGDGTYNEVVNGVTGNVPLGFLPGGGTSVLPRRYGARLWLVLYWSGWHVAVIIAPGTHLK